MASGNANSANFNSANFRTDAAPTSPIGNYDWADYSSPNFRVDTSRRYLKDSDSAIAVETAYRTLDVISLDGTNLPHVLAIQISEPSNLDTRPTATTAPYQELVSKAGRQGIVRGWADTPSDLTFLKALDDKQKHLLLLPTGDSFNVYVHLVTPTPEIYDYTMIQYELAISEAVD